MAVLTATTVVVAQAVMIVASLLAMRMTAGEGFWLVMLIPFAALPVRGLVAGLQSVAVPGLVARLLNGTGRVTVGQGAVMTVQGLGAALSLATGAWIAQCLAITPLSSSWGRLRSSALWVGFAGTLRPACAGAGDARQTEPASPPPGIAAVQVGRVTSPTVTRRASRARAECKSLRFIHGRPCHRPR